MASDPGCLRFSLLFRIRLFLPSCLHGFPAACFPCLPAFLPSHGFPAFSRLSCLLTAFLPSHGFPACTRLFLHPLQLWCVFVIRPVRPIAVFPTAVGLTLFPVGLVFVRLVVRLACCPFGLLPFGPPSVTLSSLPSGYRPATVQESPDFPRARPATCLTAALAESGRRPPVSSSSLRRRP